MNDGKMPLLVCSVQIESLEKHTWQGRVLAEGAEAAFRSERELLKAVETLLELGRGTRDGGEPPVSFADSPLPKGAFRKPPL